MWNQRYADDEYIYGTEPNSFLAEHVDLLIGPVLSLAEGEGRNAVFLASHGLKVHGVDGSEVGLAKAQALALSRGVVIQTEVADLGMFEPTANCYGSVVSISAHLPSTVRNRLYPFVERCLKPDGIIILEAYTEDQLAQDTGGQTNPDMLMTQAKIKREFPNIEPILLRELEREVREGRYHTGMASVVQFIGRKKALQSIATDKPLNAALSATRMRISGQRKQEIVRAFQVSFKRDNSAEINEIPLKELREADEIIGNIKDNCFQ